MIPHKYIIMGLMLASISNCALPLVQCFSYLSHQLITLEHCYGIAMKCFFPLEYLSFLLKYDYSAARYLIMSNLSPRYYIYVNYWHPRMTKNVVLCIQQHFITANRGSEKEHSHPLKILLLLCPT